MLISTRVDLHTNEGDVITFKTFKSYPNIKIDEELKKNIGQFCAANFDKLVYDRLNNICKIKPTYENSIIKKNKQSKRSKRELMTIVVSAGVILGVKALAATTIGASVVAFGVSLWNRISYNSLNNELAEKSSKIIELNDFISKQLIELNKRVMDSQVESRQSLTITRDMLFNLIDFKSAVDAFENALPFNYVPKSFLDTFNITSQIDPSVFRRDTQAIFQGCSLVDDPVNDKIKHLNLNLRFNLVQDHLHLYEATPFEIYLNDHRDCTLKYDGPKIIVYDSMHDTYCPTEFKTTDALLPTFQFDSKCIPLPYKDIHHHHVKPVCSDRPIDPYQLVNYHSTKDFFVVYCPTYHFIYKNQSNECPDQSILYLPKFDDLNIFINSSKVISYQYSKSKVSSMIKIKEDGNYLQKLDIDPEHDAAIKNIVRKHQEWTNEFIRIGGNRYSSTSVWIFVVVIITIVLLIILVFIYFYVFSKASPKPYPFDIEQSPIYKMGDIMFPNTPLPPAYQNVYPSAPPII